MKTVARTLACTWASPNTAFGLLFAPLAIVGPGEVRLVDGVFEIHGSAIAWLLRRSPPWPFGASALTLGHVVLAVDAAALERTRAHERVHVRQYERWGPFFIPAYIMASLVALARGRRAYRDNRFEREAYDD